MQKLLAINLDDLTIKDWYDDISDLESLPTFQGAEVAVADTATGAIIAPLGYYGDEIKRKAVEYIKAERRN